MKHTHFSLGTAFLCVTCNCVGSNSRACACCGDSTGLLTWLACWTETGRADNRRPALPG